jgi:pimeloyl-ACP methyl ester carboxylesterase
MSTSPALQLELLSRQPAAGAEEQHAVPLLFVHGAWHGAWCWDAHFLAYFAEHGYRSHALSLRGHGKSASPGRFSTTRIRDYVTDVAQVAATLDQPPVIIGHSMGCLVVEKYLETHQAPAAALLAPPPTHGLLRTTLAVAARHPLRFTRVNLTWKLYPIVEKPSLAREFLFSSGIHDDEVRDYWTRLQNEAYFAYLDMLALTLPRPRKVKTPMLVLGGEQDVLFNPREVRRTARAYGTEARLYPHMAHDMMLEPNWRLVADTILEWLQTRGL